MIARGDRYPHLCLRDVRICLGVPSKYPSAISAWRAIPKAHRHSGIAPAGYPMFYNLSDNGHVVLSLNGRGLIGTNSGYGGRMVTKNYTYFGNYLGWSTELNGVQLAPLVISRPNPPTHVFIPPPFHGPYHPGTAGPLIKEIQNRLMVPQTSVYDKATVAAVIAYQKRHPYLGTPDGIIGPKTYQSILTLKRH